MTHGVATNGTGGRLLWGLAGGGVLIIVSILGWWASSSAAETTRLVSVQGTLGERIAAIESQTKEHTRRFDGVDARLDRIEGKIDRLAAPR